MSKETSASKAQNEEPAEQKVTNPFLKKENKNTLNRKKNLFEDMMKRNLTKKETSQHLEDRKPKKI